MVTSAITEDIDALADTVAAASPHEHADYRPSARTRRQAALLLLYAQALVNGHDPVIHRIEIERAGLRLADAHQFALALQRLTLYAAPTLEAAHG